MDVSAEVEAALRIDFLMALQEGAPGRLAAGWQGSEAELQAAWRRSAIHREPTYDERGRRKYARWMEAPLWRRQRITWLKALAGGAPGLHADNSYVRDFITAGEHFAEEPTTSAELILSREGRRAAEAHALCVCVCVCCSRVLFPRVGAERCNTDAVALGWLTSLSHTGPRLDHERQCVGSSMIEKRPQDPLRARRII